MGARILVFVERREGRIKRPSLEAVSASRRLADANGGAVDALVLGAGAAGHAAEHAK
jgi:electron transfer flavoprotein alpha subunit